MRALLIRGRLWLLSAVSGGVIVLTGCDPNVREDILGGVGSAATQLATTFIGAFFQSLINDAQEGDATTVRAILEQLPQYFA